MLITESGLMSKCISILLILAILPLRAGAGQRETIRCGWKDLGAQIESRKLSGREARIHLSGGGDVTSRVLGVTQVGLLVRDNHDTRQWKTSTKGEALIPAEQVAAVRFKGRTGHGGLIGGLAGLGAGAAVGAAIATNSDITEGAFVVVIPIAAAGIAAIGGLVGYFIGRSMNDPLPEFVITR